MISTVSIVKVYCTVMQECVCLTSSNADVCVNTPVRAMVAGAMLLYYSVDLPARTMLLNMEQFNGCGCLYCEDKGTTIGTKHLYYYWPMQGSSIPRTHSSVLFNARDTITLEVHFDITLTCIRHAIFHIWQTCGIKDPTVLALHHNFDLVGGVVI